MIGYFVFGLCLLAGVLLLIRWAADADPAMLARAAKWIGIGLGAALVIALAVSGRLTWLLFLLPLVTPLIARLRGVRRTGRTGGRFGRGGSGPGRTSQVETRWVAMTLDHDSGQMDGVVRAGQFEGRSLSDLDEGEACRLLAEARAGDPQAASLIETWGDRRFGPDWRTGADSGPEGASSAPGQADMSATEAADVLGIAVDADAATIREAYRRLMRHAHPDHGGSAWLAARINRAKDVLLEQR